MPRRLLIKFNNFQVLLIGRCIHKEMTNLTQEYNFYIKKKYFSHMPRILFIKFNKLKVFLICQCIHKSCKRI